jgi:predicted nucleic acid-binding protein
LLQGSKSKKEFAKLKEYLSCQKIYKIKDELKSFEAASLLYLKCRKNGIKIRSTINTIIAEIAIENNLYLLHNDNDFINIAKIEHDLMIY